jgi:uncharacterized protein with von Willebrand factor type A (vWA) domain
LTKILAAVTMALALLCMASAVKIYQLKAAAEEKEKQHAVALSTALAKQSEDLSAQVSAEQKLRAERERQINKLLTQIKTMEDYHAHLSASLHAWINGMLVRAAEPGRMVPTDPGRSSRTESAESRTANDPG